MMVLPVQPSFSFPFLLFLFLEKKRKRKAEKKEPKKRIKEKDKKRYTISILSYPILSACLRQALLFARQKYESRVVKNTNLRERSDLIGSLSKYEQETVINFNAGEQRAVVYTRDKAVMRKLDALVIAFPEVYKLVGETDIDKTYSMPKSCVSYRKPRKLNDKYRELKRVQMKQYNMQR